MFIPEDSFLISFSDFLGLRALTLTVLHSYMYKKLDEYSKNHDLQIVTAVKKECECLLKEQCRQEGLVEIEKSSIQAKSNETKTTNSNKVAFQRCQQVVSKESSYL